MADSDSAGTATRRIDHLIRELDQTESTAATYLARADAKVNDEQLEERQRRLDQLERDLAEREHALRGGDVRWWGSDPASSH